MRRGITLLEVLVVVLLLLMLLGFAAMYVVRQRENALRVSCADNLRRLGAAVRTYVDVSGGVKPADGYLPAARIADGYATWAVQIAPALGKDSPLEAWDLRKRYLNQDEKVQQARILAFFCPARLHQRHSLVSTAGDDDPATGRHVAGALGDYAGVAGDGAAAHDWTGPDADGPIILGEVLEKKDDLIVSWRGRVHLDDLKRGQSYTLLLGEKHVPLDGLGQAQLGDGSLYNGSVPANSTRVGGVEHPLAQAPTEPFRSNFGSYHPGICQFVQADTAVRAVAVAIDAALLGKLTTRGE